MDALRGLTNRVIGAAIAVHRGLGPGLLESAYEACLAYELDQRGLAYERQKGMPVVYGALRIECAYRVDLIVERMVVIEVKSVARFEAVHRSQLLTYLRLSGCPIGLLINFNVPALREGIRRAVMNLKETPPRPPRFSAPSALPHFNHQT